MTQPSSIYGDPVDKQLIRSIDQYQQLLDSISLAVPHLKQAYFDLAQCRQSVGYHVVSPIAYDYRMKARVTVQEKEEGQKAAKAVSHEDNPIFWFGALPHAKLRSAQAGFSNALDHLISAAECKAELVQLLQGVKES